MKLRKFLGILRRRPRKPLKAVALADKATNFLTSALFAKEHKHSPSLSASMPQSTQRLHPAKNMRRKKKIRLCKPALKRESTQRMVVLFLPETLLRS